MTLKSVRIFHVLFLLMFFTPIPLCPPLKSLRRHLWSWEHFILGAWCSINSRFGIVFWQLVQPLWIQEWIIRLCSEPWLHSGTTSGCLLKVVVGFWFVCVFSDRVSCIWGWPGTCYLAKDDLEPLISLPWLLWLQKCTVTSSLDPAGNQTQGIRHCKQAHW